MHRVVHASKNDKFAFVTEHTMAAAHLRNRCICVLLINLLPQQTFRVENPHVIQFDCVVPFSAEHVHLILDQQTWMTCSWTWFVVTSESFMVPEVVIDVESEDIVNKHSVYSVASEHKHFTILSHRSWMLIERPRDVTSDFWNIPGFVHWIKCKQFATRLAVL